MKCTLEFSINIPENPSTQSEVKEVGNLNYCITSVCACGAQLFVKYEKAQHPENWSRNKLFQIFSHL